MAWIAKGTKRPFFYQCCLPFMRSVDGITESACHLHLKMGCYCKEDFLRLGVLLGLPPLSLVDLFHATSGGFSS
jgi:hypothetical protein